MNKRRLSRRQFVREGGKTLATATLLNGPLGILLDSITRGSLGRALAEQAGIQPRRWIDMRFDLSPPRWMYDQFLMNRAADRARFIQPPSSVYSKFVGGTTYTSGEYATVEMQALGKSNREIYAPHLWKLNIPKAGGGTRPFSDLLQGFLNIRGINTGNPGHPGSQALHYLPLGASQSLTAFTGDNSEAPIAAVFYNLQNAGFRSLKSKSPFVLAGTNLASELLSPFRASTPIVSIRAREQQVGDFLTNARLALEAEAKARHQDSAVVHRAISGARDLLNLSFTSLDQEWEALLAKYQALVNAALIMEIPGINDKPVGNDPSERTVVGAYSLDGEVVMNADLRTMLQGAKIMRMAESFALTEFVITHGFSDSISVGIGEFDNLAVKIGNSNGQRGSTFDEHTTGSMISTLLNSVHAVAHASCLLELIDRLKSAGMWNDTVINCSGEFNRAPRNNGGGSDHNYLGASLALYSGQIDGPHVIGDIARDSKPLDYKGTYGEGVAQTGAALENSRIDLGNVAATVAQLIGVPSPLKARESLVVISGTGIFPRLPPGKIS